jgi:hypothetical protein
MLDVAQPATARPVTSTTSAALEFGIERRSRSYLVKTPRSALDLP